MGIYIDGLQMPAKGFIKNVIILSGGNVIETTHGCSPQPEKQNYTAISVPPHGRLIDADALKDLYHYNTHDSDIDKAWTGNIRRSIDSAPTIIPAEEGET